MKLNFEVLINGEWVATRTGIVLIDGCLGHTLPDGSGGVAPSPYFRHTEETLRQSEFRRACWDSLAPEDRAAAVGRMGGVPSF